MPVLFLSKEKLKTLIETTLTVNVLSQMLLTLDPAKHYILVVPLEIPEDELLKAFDGFSGTNLVVLRAASAKLLEF